MLLKMSTGKNLTDARAALERAARAHRFGVLQVHDLKETFLREGLDLQRECLIYEICSPELAKRVLDQDMAVSALLPCRVSLYEEDGQTVFAAARPSPLFENLDATYLEDIAQEVNLAVIEIVLEAALE
jgi:uncharacterized protein (DUF302 family)